MIDLNILMVDDHPIILEGYQNVLMGSIDDTYALSFDTANDCDSAYLLMTRAAKLRPYDICFFDISIPSSKNGEINSGQDLAKIAKELMPNTKIIILTMFDESFRIHNIIKNIDPEGFLIKSDLTSSELTEAFYHILNKPPYYSSTVSNHLKKTVKTDVYLDDVNRKIVYLLSKGVKTKSLINHIDLSMSAIEKRKRQVKLLLGVEDGSDETLISEARDQGFL